jgi:mannose-6-phosphate isomerase-like protein (cupin superfamily)
MTAIRNFLESTLEDLPNCHDGIGVLKHIQLFTEQDFKSALRFLNYTVLPPGTSIGLHTHGNDEEIYIVIEGSGQMTLDGTIHPVCAGSVILNRPYGEHGLENTGNCDMKLLVFENGIE